MLLFLNELKLNQLEVYASIYIINLTLLQLEYKKLQFAEDEHKYVLLV